jgi:hypothetical protein
MDIWREAIAEKIAWWRIGEYFSLLAKATAPNFPQSFRHCLSSDGARSLRPDKSVIVYVIE